MTDITYAQVSSDHVVSVGEPGETITVKVLSGGTVYYGDRTVSSSQNQGSITVGSSAVMTNPVSWLISASSSFVQISGDVSTSGGAITAATFLGSSTVVKASGDSSGATDLANINAALAGSATSVWL